MGLKATINQDLKVALRNGNHSACDTLRLLKAEIANREIALGVREAGLTDEQIEQVVVKEVKKRREAAELYQQAGRIELAENELTEIAILEKYLPQQLSDDAIRQAIDDILTQIEPVMANMGKVIGAAKAKLGSAADGAVIARLVKEKLKS